MPEPPAEFESWPDSPAQAPPMRTEHDLPPEPVTPIGAMVWWAMLLAIVGALFSLHQLGNRAPEGVPDPGSIPSLQLKLTGRMVLGMQELDRILPGSGSDSQIAELMKQIRDDSSDTPEHPVQMINRIRGITLIAEAEGAVAGLEQLESIEDDLQSLVDGGAFGYDDADTPEVDSEEDLQDLRDDLAALRALYEPMAGAQAADATGVLPAGRDLLDVDQVSHLQDRHGWFGELAMSYGLDADDPDRAVLLEEGFRSVIWLGVAVVVLILVALASLAMFPIGIVLLATGRIRPSYDWARAEFPAPHASFLAIVPLFLLALLGVQLGAEVISTTIGIDVMFPALWLLPLVALYPLMRGVRWPQLRAGLGWHRGRGIAREIGAGILGYLALLPIVGLGLLITLLLITLFHGQPSHPTIEQNVEVNTLWDALQLILLVAVWAPIAEETVFRGAFYHHLRQRLSFVVPALITGFFFAIIHPQGLMALPVLMALGVNFALLREWRGSLIAPMIAHGMHNGFIVGLLILVML